jgi:N-acetylglucosamine kinase-like BadF-type ATPase
MGPMLGDVGGGYQIGRDALRATVKALWHPRHRTRLRDRIFDACEQLVQTQPRPDDLHHAPRGMKGILAYSLAAKAVVSHLDPSARRLHQLIDFSLLPHDRSVIASLARLVNEEAEAGDAIAIRILRDAANGLAETVHDLVDRTGIAREPYLFVGTGSVAMHSEIYWRHLSRQVKKFAPHFRPRLSPQPPVVGNTLHTLLQLNGRDPVTLRQTLFQSFNDYQKRHPLL